MHTPMFIIVFIFTFLTSPGAFLTNYICIHAIMAPLTLTIVLIHGKFQLKHYI